MVKKYKPASEKTIAKGKGISTDELSFKEALKYFQDRGKERGMNRFRYKGKVFDLSGKEIAPKAATKAAPKTAPKTAVKSVTSSPRPKTKPSTDGKPTVMSEAPNPPSYTKGPESVKITRGSGPTRTEQMRGNARTLAKARTLKGKIADAQKTLAANKQDMSLKEAKANTKKETKYPETTNPLILGARNIRNLFSGKGGLSDRKK